MKRTASALIEVLLLGALAAPALAQNPAFDEILCPSATTPGRQRGLFLHFLTEVQSRPGTRLARPDMGLTEALDKRHRTTPRKG